MGKKLKQLRLSGSSILSLRVEKWGIMGVNFQVFLLFTNGAHLPPPFYISAVCKLKVNYKKKKKKLQKKKKKTFAEKKCHETEVEVSTQSNKESSFGFIM